jgi:hypothetical protein
MKKLFFAVSALAALSLLAPSTGFAQTHEYSNQVGLYMTPDGTGLTGNSDLNLPVLVYLVLTKPTDVANEEAAYTTIQAFECTLNFNPAPNNDLFALNVGLPQNAINVGVGTNINDGFLDYIVGIDFNHPLLVTEESTVLITFTFMNQSTGITEVTLSATSAASIDGQMAFESEEGQLRIMYSAGGSFDDPVFKFNAAAVAVDNESFGSVKALFR